MKNNITYFLGSGASCNSIPITEKFNNVFRGAIKPIDKSLDKIMTRQDDVYKGMLKLRNDINHFSSHADKFNTIDTYAKKLFLQGDEQQLSDLKTTISLFFTIWQLFSNKHEFIQKEVPKVVGIVVKDEHKRNVESKYEYIDHRYVTLLSSLLKRESDKIVLDDNINFISWNYDVQLEMAIGEFIDINFIDYIIEEYFVYPNINDKKNTGPFKIVHLNGIAGFYEINDKNERRTLFGQVDKKSSLDTILEEVSFVPNLIKKIISINRTLSYAWETDNAISKKAIQEASRIMSDTDVLVIIGYSFPAFNKDIDKELFMKLVNNKRLKMIYYQDPNANIELLKNRFNIPLDNITPVKDVRQFEIPLRYL